MRARPNECEERVLSAEIAFPDEDFLPFLEVVKFDSIRERCRHEALLFQPDR